MSISRVEQMKHIESKVRRCNKKFPADRQSFIAWNRVWMGFRATGISIVSDARINDLIGKVAHELLTSPRGRNNFGTGVCRRVRFRSCGTVGYRPTMWVKGRKGDDILHGHDSKACQRVACQLCRQQPRYQGRGTKRTIFLLVERGGPIGKVPVRRWLPKCHPQ